MREERFDCPGRDAELLDHDAREIRTIKSRSHIEIRINETHVLQLVNAIGNFFRPIATGRLNHAVRKTMERDIKNMSTGAFEECGESAQLIMMLHQQNFAAKLR